MRVSLLFFGSKEKKKKKKKRKREREREERSSSGEKKNQASPGLGAINSLDENTW